jgi:hypothetical protein
MQKLFLTIIACLALSMNAGSVFAQNKGAKSTTTTAAKEKKRVKKKAAKKKTVRKQAKSTIKSKDQRRSKKSEKTKSKSDEAKTGVSDAVKNALEDMSSADPDVVIEAIQTLGATEAISAVSEILALLKTGPRSDITDAILFTLGTLPHEDAEPVLIEYLNHRRADARIAAILALENYKGETVTMALEAALADSDRQVRASAAMTLGKRGSKRSVPILFKAFERGVVEAAIAIGQVGSEDDAKHLTRYLGKEDIKILLAGFEEFLKRDDFPEEAKLSILNRLFDLAGPEVWRFAVTYKATFPPDTDENENRVYKLVCRMVRQIKDK